MRLSDLTIEASDLAPKHMPGRPLRWRVHHVKEIFMASLPRGLEIDGSGKIQLSCGPRGAEPSYRQVLGTSNYFVEDFPFELFSRLPQAEADNHVLGIIEGALLDIAARHGASPATSDAIRATARVVRDMNFSAEIRVDRLSKASPNREFQAAVYRKLSPEHGEAWLCRMTNKKSKTDVIEDWMTPRPHYLDLTDYFRTSLWSDGHFVVLSRLGKEVYRSAKFDRSMQVP